jgi:BON domain
MDAVPTGHIPLLEVTEMKSIRKGITGAVALGAALAFSPMAFAQSSAMPPGPVPPETMPIPPAGSATQPSDSALTQEVKSALANDPGTYQSKINVAAQDGIVHLRGRVSSMATKQHAQQVVAQIQGVRSIDNELRVRSD